MFFLNFNRYVSLMNFVTRPFTRLQRSYADVYDHYLDYWRFRINGPDKSDRAAISVLPRNSNQFSNFFLRKIYTPFKRIFVGNDNVKAQRAQRRSWRRRHRDGAPWRQSYQYQAPPQYQEEYIEDPYQYQESRSLKEYNQAEPQYGPLPSVTSAEETVVKPLHESADK